MLGCMTETSCGVSAASQLSPMVDFADLDGNLLISNDVFDGVKVVNGKITLNDRPGIGVEVTKDVFVWSEVYLSNAIGWKEGARERGGEGVAGCKLQVNLEPGT